ncbi:MAG: DUF475 domain-containing protein [Candidatus Gastranaerophilales bacterium]|nr:DUF475 domain-containing protein [Candidatus Gastranaerophilales bacterium]
MKPEYFKGSYIVTIAGIISAYLWGEHVLKGSGTVCVFVALVLGVLEVSLSFDNAVVNAVKLRKMTDIWRHRFITWGIAIAVFGMRFLFPLLVVSIFAKLNILKVLDIALHNAKLYALYLHQTHATIVTFGGTFLLMLFLGFFLNPKKKIDWIKPVEKILKKAPANKILDTLITLAVLDIVQVVQPAPIRMNVIFSGLAGVIIYLAIDAISKKLEELDEKYEEHKQENCRIKHGFLACSGLISFLYLELIDASFSLDGVLGAFALSHDIVIITIGLAIGAMFVRSLTIMFVEEGTLDAFIYLEHGAHWAIGVLAVLMFISTVIIVPEVVTGLTGLGFIIASVICSKLHKESKAQ